MKTFVIDVETTGLNSMESRITCICAKDMETKEMHTFIGEDEASILTRYWALYDKYTRVVGFNVDAFDLPFIVKRSIINNVRVADNFDRNIRDLRKAANSFFLCYEKLAKGKLSDWAEVMGIEVATHNGALMPKLFEKRDWKKIEEHCIEDVEITTKLYERLKHLNIISG